MCGAIPSGCRLARSTLTGGSSRWSATSAVSAATPRLAASMPQWRSITSAGFGSCAARSRSSVSRTGSISGSSSPRCP